MSKESKYSSEPNRCVFRETFNSEADVRKNGGVTTNVTFQNGVAIFASVTNYISYFQKFYGTYSIRIKFKLNSLSTYQYLFDFRGSGSGLGATFINPTTGVLTNSGPTNYVNGIVSNSVSLGVIDYVASGIPIKSKGFIIGNNGLIQYYLVADIELFEIYNYALSAQEILNL